MNKPKNNADVKRLLDIVVEEVSLVDRAANKRRFLIVKRSNDMDENNQADDVAGAVNDDTDAQDEVPGGDTELEAASDSPLAIAVEALEGLTDAVEALSGVKDEDVDAKLSAVATGLKAMSARLASAITDAGSSTEDSGESASTPDGGKESVSSVLATVRDALQDVTRLLGESASIDKADGDPPKKPQPKSKPREDKDEDPEETSKGSGSIADAVRALVDAVKGQPKRLTRMEKRFGLPSSLPVGEGISESDREDNSWSMDLNNPMDRESVDKSVSFHEV